MEASALFSIASLYQVDIAALFAISDTHADLEWKPSSDDVKTREGLHALLRAALTLT